MVYDLRKAKGTVPRPSTIVGESKGLIQNALSSSTQPNLSHSSTSISNPAAASHSTEARTKMASSNEPDDHSSKPNNTRSKMIVLKVGDKLRTLGANDSVLSDSNARRTKIVKIQVSPQNLAKVANQKPHFKKLSTQPSLNSNGAVKAMIKSPDVRHRLSTILISETGSPLRTRDVQPIPNSHPEPLKNASKLQLEKTSNFLALRDDTNKTPSELLTLSPEIPPTPLRRQMNITSAAKKYTPSSPSEPLDLPNPGWRKRQLQLLQQLGLSADAQQHNASSQFSQHTGDIKSTWPQGPTPLRDFSFPLRSTDALLSDKLYNSYAPYYKPISLNTQSLLPVTMSASLAAEDWRQKLDPGAYGLPSASTQTDPDDLETPKEFKERLINVLRQMMFVSGETAEASAETTGMIEEIVRAQVIEMVSTCLPRFVTVPARDAGIQGQSLLLRSSNSYMGLS